MQAHEAAELTWDNEVNLWTGVVKRSTPTPVMFSAFQFVFHRKDNNFVIGAHSDLIVAPSPLTSIVTLYEKKLLGTDKNLGHCSTEPCSVPFLFPSPLYLPLPPSLSPSQFNRHSILCVINPPPVVRVCSWERRQFTHSHTHKHKKTNRRRTLPTYRHTQ